MNLFDFEKLINNNPMHIATVNIEGNPNLSVASDIKVIEKNKIIISVNEMNNTQKNILNNDNVVLTIFDENWIGLRLFGKAEFFETGKYYDFCKKQFFSEGQVTPFGATKPKGAIIITVEKLEEYK